MPLIAKAWEKQDFKQIHKLYEKSSINQLIFGGFFFLCIWLNINEIFGLLPEKFQGGKWVVFFIGLSQLFNITSGINGVIIVNSKYYRYDLITNLFLVFFTITANYFLIPIYGINGAALATALSVFLFNFIRLIFIKVKMDMHPFNIKTLYTILLLLTIYFLSKYIPIFGNIYLDLLWKSCYVLMLFVPMVLWLKLSEDINNIVSDIKKRLEM